MLSVCPRGDQLAGAPRFLSEMIRVASPLTSPSMLVQGRKCETNAKYLPSADHDFWPVPMSRSRMGKCVTFQISTPVTVSR